MDSPFSGRASGLTPENQAMTIMEFLPSAREKEMNIASPACFLLFPSKPHFLFSRPATRRPTWEPAVDGARLIFQNNQC
jgi:hypothetical protein